MPKYEFLISVKDEPDDPNPRKKEGDIVSVRPYPWNWGGAELNQYFVIIADVNATIAELRQLVEHGLYQNKTTSQVITEQEYEVLTTPVQDGGGGQDAANYERISKHRFTIPFADTKTYVSDLDLFKVQDKTIYYQPFKNKQSILQSQTWMQAKDLDCSSVHKLNENKELSIDMELLTPIVWDKLTNTKLRLSSLK